MSSRLTSVAAARQRAWKAWQALPPTATAEDLIDAKARLLEANSKWLVEIARVAAQGKPVAA